MADSEKVYRVALPSEYLSRGTGEQIALSETTVLDFMPNILGSRFMAIPELRAALHQYGKGAGSFIASEEAYRGLAEDELAARDLTASLEAYKKALHYGTSFVKGISTLQGGGALTMDELDKLNLNNRYGSLEQGLIDAVVSQEVGFNPTKYADFVSAAREREKREAQLNQLFYQGKTALYGSTEVAAIGDPNVGREYIDLSVAMGNYDMAAGVAGELGYEEKAMRYDEQAAATPRDTPKAQLYLDLIRAKYGIDY